MISIRVMSMLLATALVSTTRCREEELLGAEDAPTPVSREPEPARRTPSDRRTNVREMLADTGDPEGFDRRSRTEWLLASYPRTGVPDPSRGHKGKRKPTRRERREANRRSR